MAIHDLRKAHPNRKYKTRAISEELYSFYQKDFERLAAAYEGKPKGITSAFLNPDGTPGPSFMELKLRSLLIKVRQHAQRTGRPLPPLPVFQMTSVGNHHDIVQALYTYTESPFLGDLARALGFDCGSIKTAVQPLLAAYTGAAAGKEKARELSRAN